LNNIRISPRMRCLQSMVIEGETVADVGTDHGFVPLDLLAENAVPYAILTDINQGPLDIAKKHADDLDFNLENYDLRLGSGLEPLKKGEAATVIIAGMGGEMIEAILDYDKEKSKSFKRFVLQPRTHANELRHYLSLNGYKIADYSLVKEKGRICEVFAAEPTNDTIKEDTALISEFLINKGDALLAEFIDYKIKMAKSVIKNLTNSSTEDSAALSEIWNSILDDLNCIRKRI